jgi:CDP-glucose 4,6-dehydratase
MSDTLPVSKMVEMAVDCWGKGSYVVTPPIDGQLHEAGLLKLDISKTVAELGWKPKFNAATAIEKTISWYKSYGANKAGINQFTEDEILEFLRA